MRGEG